MLVESPFTLINIVFVLLWQEQGVEKKCSQLNAKIRYYARYKRTHKLPRKTNTTMKMYTN